jgi:carboxyl-terminal processing protease
VAGSATALGAAAVISATTYPGRAYREAVGTVPVALRQQTSSGSASSAAVAATSRTPPVTTEAAAQDNAKIAWLTGKLLTKQHFLHHPLDTTISNRLFDSFLDALDPQHVYFTQADVAEWAPLRDKLAKLIDQDQPDTSFSQTAFDRFRQRANERQTFVMDALKTRDFTFTSDDYYSLDRRKAARPKDENEARQLWMQQLRAEYLQYKLTPTKKGEKPLTAEAIKDKLNKRYARIARNLKEMGADDVFEVYVTKLCNAFDPHSDYFGKTSTESFNISMKLSLYGIGAQLQQSDEGFVKIMQLTPGGPAVKSKKLKVGDQITAVAQQSGESVEVQDMNINKVVEMIRGPKGTPVTLTLLPAGATDPSTRKQITLVRDEIRLEEQAAKAQIIDLPTGSGGAPLRLGIVDLPSFYGGGDSNRSATDDVRRLLEKLKREKVAGVVLDLRRNGGGSLPEAISVTGLFIPKGPVVQVVSSDKRREVDRDDDASVVYDGPLAVLTSRMSASASEIVAGALQDYGRALVLGDGQTFGKGTVQQVMDLNNVMRMVNIQTSSDPGSLHLTVQQFYRPGGASTQLKGVVSDIVIPSATSVLDIGERTLDNPLPFSTIEAARFDRTNRVQPYLTALKQRSEQRVANNKLFAFLKQDIARYEKTQKEKRVSLNEAQRLKEKQEADARDAARKKTIAALNASSAERVYAITLADVNKPGLPAALKPKQANAKNSQSGPEGDADALSDDASADGETGTGLDRDITLDEAKRILADYVTMVRK